MLGFLQPDASRRVFFLLAPQLLENWKLIPIRHFRSEVEIINMAKVSIVNIEVLNPTDSFTSDMKIKIHLKAFSQLEDGSLKRPRVHGHLRGLRR